MRTEITFTPHSALRRRIDYVTDADGAHKAAGLEVRTFCVGVAEAAELPDTVRRLVSGSAGRRGRKRKHVAWEITLHPADADGAKGAFRSPEEMERVAREVISEFGARYALVGLHGLQDIHILMANWGPTGLGLKSCLPNRSNPRRVLVAVADRIERALNEERRKQGIEPLVRIQEVRAEKREARGRRPMSEQIAEHLETEQEPSVSDVLRAIGHCGWVGVANAKRVSISFSPVRPPFHFELDLLMRGVRRAWLVRDRSKNRERAHVKQITSGLPKHENRDPARC